jgi:hypothetical protein
MNTILQKEEIMIGRMNEGLEFVLINDSEKHIGRRKISRVRIYKAPRFKHFCLTENGDKEYVKSDDVFLYLNVASSIISILYHKAFNDVRYLF